MNVLFIVVDDLRPDLGCYGHSLAHTPHIDRLASRGVAFSNAYTNCALCNPGRASLFSGLRPDTTGVKTLKEKLRHRLPHMVTLPQALRQRGYYSARAGKVFHMGVPDTIAMGGSGNDDIYAWDEFVNCPGKELNTQGYYYNATPYDRVTAGPGGAVSWLRAVKGDNEQHDYNVATQIADRIRRTHDKPFFLAAGFIRPHVPFVAPRRFFDLYDPDAIDMPNRPREATPLLPCVERRFGAGFGIGPADHRKAVAAYLACVSFLDEQVGRVLQALDSTGLTDETLIVFTADHGYQLGEHDLWFKNFLYRESTRIPLIIADPRRRSSYGKVAEALVENVDVYPTVMELLGMPMPHHAEGVSLVPVMEGAVDEVRRAVFAQCHGNVEGRSIRTHEWVYSEWNGGREGRELFDLHSDPGEYVNLAAENTTRSISEELAGKLRSTWRDMLLTPTDG